MWVKITEPDSFRCCLWLVVPDHPKELPVLWLVKGKTPDDLHSITIPVKRVDLPALIEALVDASPIPPALPDTLPAV